ncbi:MAG: nuclear transport factor 2 family protein [Microthrixaceae bacterium]|nr:nuclear transport factor 2 family protein [Acidimicrobiales bacterium]MCB9403117.1 nuclear transport factor 2 family protein [Microthrixaceae bacterium]
MDVSEVIHREQIRHLLASYTWAGDRGRIEELADLFTLDGVLDVGAHGDRWAGRAAIVDGLRAVIERTAAAPGREGTPGPVHHDVSSVLITEVEGGRARANSYFAVRTSIGLDHWGRYFDRLELEIGRWRFSERIVVVDGSSPGSLMVRT